MQYKCRNHLNRSDELENEYISKSSYLFQLHNQFDYDCVLIVANLHIANSKSH